MADRRKSVTEKADPRAMETLRYLTLLKDSQGLFSELGKNVQKHTAQLAALASSCAVLVDNLQRIGEQEKGDLGEVIKQIAEAHKTSGDNLGKHAQAWTEHLLQDINTRLNTDKLDVANFDKNFKAKRAASVKNLKKAEANQAKANKPKMKSKSPDKAEEANAQMAQAEQEHDTMLCEQLKEVVVLERKKYCHLLQQLDTLCTAQAELYRAEVMVMENINALVAPVAASEEVIPENVIQILNADAGATEWQEPPAGLDDAPGPEGMDDTYAQPEMSAAQEVTLPEDGQQESFEVAQEEEVPAPEPIAQEFACEQQAETDPGNVPTQDADIAAALTEIDELAAN